MLLLAEEAHLECFGLYTKFLEGLLEEVLEGLLDGFLPLLTSL